MTDGPARALSRRLNRPDEGDAIHQVERGHHHVLLRLGTHSHQVVLAEPAVDEGQQVAFGVLGVELLDELVRQFMWQPLVEARPRRQALRAAVLDVLGD